MEDIWNARDNCIYIDDDLAPNQDKERLIAECSNAERAEQIAHEHNCHEQLVEALKLMVQHTVRSTVQSTMAFEAAQAAIAAVEAQ